MVERGTGCEGYRDDDIVKKYMDVLLFAPDVLLFAPFSELRLDLSEENGDLVYRSRGHLIKFGTFEFVVPDHCVLGKATIREHALSDRQFALDFRIEHPLWGRVFGYRGIFEL